MARHAKKKRLFNDEDKAHGEDRISALHDSLIHHILSFLPADAVMKTSLLSKRWKGLWNSVHSLDFNEAASMEGESFMFRFIRNYLMNYNGSKLFKFRANFYYRNVKFLFVDSLLSFVMMHGIEELDLHLSAMFWNYFNRWGWKNFPVNFQSCLYGCKELRVLRLSCFDFKELDRSCFNYLEVLDLRLANFEYLDTSGCPFLKDLRLVDCNIMSTLDLHAPNKKLRNLSIVDSNTEWGEGGRIIYAPHVVFFDICGDLRPCYDIKDLSSTVDVRLDFSEILDIVQSPDSYDAFMMLMKLIKSLRHAIKLKLCRSCITVFSYVKELKCDIPHFSALSLEVESIFNESELIGLANILSNASNLEYLTINIGNRSSWDSWKKCGPDPTSDSWVVPELSCSIKTVTINNLFRNTHIYFDGQSVNSVDKILEGIEEEISLVKHFLSVSNKLEKMTILISNDIMLLQSISLFLPSIKKKLIDLPRASINAEILIS